MAIAFALKFPAILWRRSAIQCRVSVEGCAVMVSADIFSVGSVSSVSSVVVRRDSAVLHRHQTASARVLQVHRITTDR